MKNTMKTFEAIELCACLEPIVTEKTRKMAGSVAWNIGRTYKSLSTIKKDFEEMQQNKIIAMYDEGKTSKPEDSEDGMIKVLDEYMAEYGEYINEIATTDTDVDIYTISQKDFEKLLDTCDLSVIEADAVSKLIKQEEEDE